MVSKSITFIVNPNAAGGSTGLKWKEITSGARDRLGAFTTHITTGPGHATQLAHETVLSGTELIVCVGGDGTLNEVVNGLMIQEGSPKPDVLLGYIPRGTGCDLARSITFPHDLDRAFDNILNRRSRYIDLGRVTYRDHNGRASCRYFHNVVSFGLGGEVDQRVNRNTKAFGGFISFALAALISILLSKKKRIHLSVDDYFDEAVTSWNVAVANGQYHGGGMWVAPDAALTDGLFQVTVIGDMNIPELFWNLPKLYSGRIYEVEKVKRLTGRRIEASSFQQVLLDIDGEQPGKLPAVLEIIPSAIRMICDV